MGFSRQEYCRGLPCLPPGDLSNPGIASRSPALQADSLPSEPPGKPKFTEVGSLSLLQGNLPTQESNWGLLQTGVKNLGQILYQLSYPGSSYTEHYTHTLIAVFFLSFFSYLARSGFSCSTRGLCCLRWALSLRYTHSLVVVQGLSSCDLVAQLHVGS